MLVSLLEVMNRREETVQVEAEIGFDVFRANGIDCPIRRKTPVHLTLVSPAAKRVLVQAEAEYVLSAPCDRCLREVELPFEIHYEQEIDFSKSEEERAQEMEETSCISGYELDVDRLVFEELLVAFPAKILCKKDCKGICDVCGADLNAGECGCGREAFEEKVDPRMAVVRDIFRDFNKNSGNTPSS